MDSQWKDERWNNIMLNQSLSKAQISEKLDILALKIITGRTKYEKPILLYECKYICIWCETETSRPKLYQLIFQLKMNILSSFIYSHAVLHLCNFVLKIHIFYSLYTKKGKCMPSSSNNNKSTSILVLHTCYIHSQLIRSWNAQLSLILN